MSESPILEYWPEGIAAARIPANNNVRLLQALLLNPAISATTAAQPGSPAEGDVYILPAAPSGAMWSAFNESDVVIYYNATWTAYAPPEGLLKFVEDEGEEWQFIGDSSGGWAPFSGGGGGGGTTVSVITEASTSTMDPATHAGLNRYIRCADDVTFNVAEGYASGQVYNLRATAALTMIGTGVTLNAPAGGTLDLDADMSVTVVMIDTDEGDVIGQTVPL